MLPTERKSADQLVTRSHKEVRFFYRHPKELEILGHIVKGKIINVKSRVSKKEISIQFVNLERNDKIYETDQLWNLKITTKLS